MLVAATGVGAGDMLTASIAGSAVGVAVLWAVLLGALMKWFLNEGIARWQMATGSTLLEGWSERLGTWIQWVFLFYLFCWTFFTGGALITACGVAGTGLIPVSTDPVTSKIFWGVMHSGAGLVLVLFGGFKLFEKMMSAFIGLMFITVLFTAATLKHNWSEVGSGFIIPTIPEGGLGWILGIVGGVGGTVTLLSYGYWIREQSRTGVKGLRTCRIDLAVGYTMTALFGIAMVLIGSKVQIKGGGANTALILAQQLGQIMGPAGRWIFLVGFWGAVFSSLLGVWQSIPYLYADFITLRRGINKQERDAIDYTKTSAYKIYLFAISILPLPVLWISVKKVQLIYAVFGSLFMPLLALTLLILNNHSQWISKKFHTKLITNIVLVLTLVFFGYIGYIKAIDKIALFF